MTPHATLDAARAALEEGRFDAVFGLADTLADTADPAVQAALAALLRAAGAADPVALSVFLAANAHRMPQATIRAAARALPETD